VKGFVTVKAGFNNFMVTDKGIASGFVNQVSNVPSGDTHFALYPGGGVEFFFGHVFGIRGEVGDEMYWQNGANHNLKIKIGPQFRWQPAVASWSLVVSPRPAGLAADGQWLGNEKATADLCGSRRIGAAKSADSAVSFPHRGPTPPEY
jgi:hypothetical protein